MRSSCFCLLISCCLSVLACGPQQGHDPDLKQYPGLEPTRIGAGRYLFSFRDLFQAARSVTLVGNFRSSGKSLTQIPLQDLNKDGVYRTALQLDPGTYYYKLLVNEQLLVVPDNPPSIARNMRWAGRLFVPNPNAPFVENLHPDDEATVTNLHSVRFRINGNRGLLGKGGLRVILDGKQLKLDYDLRSGKAEAGVDQLKEGQHFIQLIGEDRMGNEVLEYQSVFYLYEKGVAAAEENDLQGKTAYRLLIPAFAGEGGSGMGTLRDLMERLDYLNNGKADGNSLGIKLLILHAMVPAVDPFHTQVLDYDGVDPAIGTLGQLDRLLDACKKRNIKVIIHYNMAYISNRHSFFQQSYGNPASKKWTMFFFRNDQGTSYLSYADEPALPRINISNEYASLYFVENIWKWIRAGADGVYFDHADLLPDSWWLKVARSIGQYRRRYLLTAPFIGPAGYMEQLLQDKFQLLEDIRFSQHWGMAFMGKEPRALATMDRVFAGKIPTGYQYLRPTSLGRSLRPASFMPSRRHLACALGYLLTSGGVPVINYGDEIGLQSVPPPLHENPPLMRWPQVRAMSQNPNSLLNLTKRLIMLREIHPELNRDLSGGRSVLIWQRNRDNRYHAFIRRIQPRRFFLGLLVYDDKLEQVSPRFKLEGLADGPYIGRDAILPSAKSFRASIKQGRLHTPDIPTFKRPFVLYRFDRQ